MPLNTFSTALKPNRAHVHPAKQRAAITILLLSTLLALNACNHSGSEAQLDQDNRKTSGALLVPQQIRSSRLDSANIKAYIRIDDGERQAMQLSDDGQSARFESAALKTGQHSFSIEFEYVSQEFGTYLLTSARRSIEVGKGSNSLEFQDNDFTEFTDTDGDTYTNLLELEHGSHPNVASSKPVGDIVVNAPPLLYAQLANIAEDSVTVKLKLDDAEPVSLTYNSDAQRYEGEIVDILSGSKNIELVYEYNSSNNGLLRIAAYSTSLDITLGMQHPVNPAVADISYDDQDNDSAFTLVEDAMGSDPQDNASLPEQLIFFSRPAADKAIGIWDDIVVYLSRGDINPNSISNDTVRLYSYTINDNFPGEAGTVSYDPALRRIAFKTTLPLQYDDKKIPKSRYLLQLANMKSSADADIDTVVLAVNTFQNPLTERYAPKACGGSVPSTPVGCVSSYSRDIYNANGQIERKEFLSSNGANIGASKSYLIADIGKDQTVDTLAAPGADGLWLTDDDEIEQYRAYEYDANNQITQQYIYFDAGDDAVWHSDDDLKRDRVTFKYNAEGQQVQVAFYDNAGADGRWETTDDVIRSYRSSELDNNGNVAVSRDHNGAGPDTLWFTLDDLGVYTVNEYNADQRLVRGITYNQAGADNDWSDVRDNGIQAYSKRDYDAHLNQRYQILFSDPGNDGNWFTDDDVGLRYTRYFFAVSGNPNPIRTARINGAGADNKWGTADDFVERYTLKTQGEFGRITLQADFSSAGADGIMGNADDVMNGDHYTVNEYGANGQLSRIIQKGPGANAIWIDNDDMPISYNESEYNENNRLTRRVYYDTAGNDGQWFNADDHIEAILVYQYDAQGRGTQTTRYVDPGADLAWNTADDIPSFHNTTEYNARGQIQRTFNYTGPGNDGQWFSADDAGRSTLYEYNPHGSRTRQINYIGPGADDSWLNEDDAVGNYTVYEFDANGNRLSVRFYRSGADQVISDDDELGNVEIFDTRF